MHHQDIHELLALDLYGELDSTDRERLDAHVADCPACRAFALELRHGLGRLAGAALGGDLPGDWRVRLQREVEVAARRAPAPRGFVVGAAVGLAAGVVIAWGIVAATAPARGASEFTANDAAANRSVLSASIGAPPRAQAGGELARLQRYLRK
jgi:anti-sigma factor RsiW